MIDAVPHSVGVFIAKNVKLVSTSGPGVTTIGSPSMDIAVYFENVGSSAELAGFRIETLNEGYACVDALSPGGLHSQSSTIIHLGIKCNAASPRVDGNEIVSNRIGVELNGGSSAVIEANTIWGNVQGIVSNGSDATIRGNTAYDCGSLIESWGGNVSVDGNECYIACAALSAFGGSLSASDNVIHDVDGSSIYCSGLTSLSLERNEIQGTANGLRLFNIAGPVGISNNLLVAERLFVSNSPASAVEGNTFIGGTIQFYSGSGGWIRRNIVASSWLGIECVGASPVIECNNVFNASQKYGGDCPDQTGINGNISVDPQFCGIPGSGNYYLQSSSPCAPNNHPDGTNCGQIGAFGVACGSVATKETTWGGLKALYRDQE
jgi:parallel beta-helix repeat protein